MSNLVRNKVIINKTSLEVLEELNVQAEKVGCQVVVGTLTKGSEMLGGSLTETKPFYMVLDESTFKEPMKAMAETRVSFNKEDVLKQLLDVAKGA